MGIVEGIAETLLAEKDEGNTDVPLVLPSRIAGKSLYNIEYLVESYIENVVINIRKGKSKAANLTNTIANSRAKDGSLTTEYVAWCTAFFDHGDVGLLFEGTIAFSVIEQDGVAPRY